MKVLALILLVVAAASARSTGLQGAPVALGETPFVVHIRLAVSTSGYLNSCVGSLISNRWVLTSKKCVENSRFIWLRYGVVEVIKPSFVTESSTAVNHPTADLALVNINRDIEFTDNIAPIELPSDSDKLAETGFVSGFLQTEDGAPGERLYRVGVTITEETENWIESTSDEEVASKYDIGAGLVVENKLVGVLSDYKNGEGGAGYVKVAAYLDWIKATAGL